jgi:hypothetical protein
MSSVGKGGDLLFFGGDAFGGAGEGAARVFARQDATSATGFGWLREVFVDGGGNSVAADLQATGDEELAERAAGVSAEIETSPVVPWRLGEDFRVGDLTPVDAGLGSLSSVQSVAARVEAVTLTHDGASWVESPEIGQPLGDPLAVQRRLLAGVRRRGRI